MKKSRIISLGLALALTLTACGGGDGGSGSQSQSGGNNTSTINKEVVFREQTDFLTVSENSSLSNLILAGNKIYTDEYIYNLSPEMQARLSSDSGIAVAVAEEAVAVTEKPVEEVNVEEPAEEESSTAEETEASEDYGIADDDIAENGVMEPALADPNAITAIRRISSYDLEGKQLSTFDMPLTMNQGAGNMVVDEAGIIYTVEYQYPTYEGDDTKDKTYLVSYDANGNELWRNWLNEKIGENDYFYVRSLYLTAEGQPALATNRGIEFYDKSGAPADLLEVEEIDSSSFYQSRNDSLILVKDNGQKASMQVVDLKTKTLGEKMDIPFNFYRYSVFNQSSKDLKFDLYLSDDYGIYGYNFGDAELTPIMDYISSEFAGYYMYYLLFLDDETFIGSYYGDDGQYISRFTKVPPEEIPDKVELTIGCYYLDSNVKTELVKFNKNSEEYRINIRDYSRYDTMNDYTQGITRMNTDIVSGDVPDILLLNTDMPITSYISKGIFADLNEFIEKDETFKREDFLPNVFEALSTDGSLYMIAPRFSVSTFAAKAAIVGDKTGWTMDEALAILNKQPEGTELMGQMLSTDFVSTAVYLSGSEYVDWENGTCHFDEGGFKKLLEFAATLPKELDYSNMDDNDWMEIETQYREGRALMSSAYLSTYRDYNYVRYGTFGEDITLVGFPSESKTSGTLNISTRFAISSQSEYQQQAWEFLKQFFAEDYQDSFTYEFPVRLSSLKKMEEAAQKKPTMTDIDGNVMEYDDYYYIGDLQVEIKPMTAAEAAALTEYLKSITEVMSPNQTIMEIISEETAPYFEGQKSADEVIDIIQSRVKIYVSENS